MAACSLTRWRIVDHAVELKKLHQLLLLRFGELLDRLLTSPETYKAKVQEIEVILVNMHHLMNSYRPHQVREPRPRCRVLVRYEQSSDSTRRLLPQAQQVLLGTLEQQIQRRLQSIQQFTQYVSCRALASTQRHAPSDRRYRAGVACIHRSTKQSPRRSSSCATSTRSSWRLAHRSRARRRSPRTSHSRSQKAPA